MKEDTCTQHARVHAYVMSHLTYKEAYVPYKFYGVGNIGGTLLYT